jgi:hypothetical protein
MDREQESGIMTELFSGNRYIVITGNYGSGKTEISLNMAMESARRGKKTTIVDLDIVNPYFRTGEKAEILEQSGIRVLMPTYALTTVDIPALPAEIQSVFEVPSDHVIFDVGGDDTGAAALGRYYPSFMKNRKSTLTVMVVNCMRPLTMEKDLILDIAGRIENRGRLKIDVMINNTNLAGQTTPEMIERGEEIILSCAAEKGITKVYTSGMKPVLDQCRLHTPLISIERYMVPEWMEEQE